MEKKHYILLFSILAFIQLGVAARMVIQQEKVLQKGQVFLFKAAPVDPNDPFRGKYITLRFEAEQYEESENMNTWVAGEETFVHLTTNILGFAEVYDLSKDPPQDDIPYFKATIEHVYIQDSQAKISLSFPFDRYYMEESKAPEAERVYREAFREAQEDIYAVVFVKEGKCVLEDVKIGDRSIKDLSAEKSQ